MVEPWIIVPTSQWYEVLLPALPAVPSGSGTMTGRAASKQQDFSTALEQEARELLHLEGAKFDAALGASSKDKSALSIPGLSGSDKAFAAKILSSGTLSDRVSALLLLVSTSPLHCTAQLEQLAQIATKGSTNRDRGQRALMAVCEWWRGPSGAPARKLRYFAEHQHEFAAVAAAKDAAKGASSKGGKKGKRENGTDSTAAVDYRQHLLVWAFEDWLKRFFFDVLRAIERLSNDTVVHSRTQAVGVLSSLLQDKPEQESNILRLLVNKLVRPGHFTALQSFTDVCHDVCHRATTSALWRQRPRICCSTPCNCIQACRPS